MGEAKMHPVDEIATIELGEEFLRAIKRHYLSRPFSRDTVCEVLNGLTWAASEVLRGTGDEGRKFFDDALALNLSEPRV